MKKALQNPPSFKMKMGELKVDVKSKPMSDYNVLDSLGSSGSSAKKRPVRKNGNIAVSQASD